MAYQNFLIELVHRKTNCSRQTVSVLWRVFVESILDCLASDGWLEIPGLGRFLLKKNAKSWWTNPITRQKKLIDPKPYIYIKVRKKARQYLESKLKELGIDWDSVVQRTRKRGRNLSAIPKLQEYFRRQDEEEKKKELGIL